MAGDATVPLTRLQRRRLVRRVRLVERRTGLEVVVHVGGTPEHPRTHAERLLDQHHHVPVVLLAVDPVKRHVEVRTTAAARGRLSDEHAAEVVARMRPAFAAGRLAQGLLEGLELLERRAVRGRAGTVDLPEVFGA